jgi:hypothetical protein
VTSSDDSRRRRLVRNPAFARDIDKIRQGSERAAEAVAAFEGIVVRIPEQGMAVPGSPGARSFPFHTDQGSYLVIYTFNAREVVCLAVRPVRSRAF